MITCFDPFDPIYKMKSCSRIFVRNTKIGEILLRGSRNLFINFNQINIQDFGMLKNLTQGTAIPPTHNQNIARSLVRVDRDMRQHFVIYKIIAFCKHY